MVDYAKVKVDELKKMIVEDSKGLITEETVNAIKGKASLVDVHKTIVGEFMVEDDVGNESVAVEEAPDYMSEKWSDYLLSLLKKDELNDGNPNVAGLRRLSHMVFDDVLVSGPKNVWTTLEDKPAKSTVLYEIVYVHRGVQKVASSVASSWVGNTDDEYVPFSESVAETRAEGRVLRKILGIKNVCADELTNKNTKQIVRDYVESQQQVAEGSITHVQKTVISKLCERLNIDLNKFVNCGSKKYDNMDNVPYDVATKMIQRLNEYQTVGEGSIDIPEEIKL